MAKITIWAFLLFFFIALSQGSFAAGEKVIIIKKEQNGQEIQIKAGDLVQIELPAIGGTGYSWYIDKLDEQHLRLLAEETRRGPEAGKVGAPVTQVWRFQAARPGRTAIKMDYYRKWEGWEKAADHFLLNLKVGN